MQIPSPRGISTCITPLQITANDHLPKIICVPCSHQLQEAYRFSMKCRLSDSKLRDRLTRQVTIVVAESDDDQQIPDRIVDEFIELPSAKPKDQNEILVDLMMRREDELFDEIIEQEKFSADETSDGESLERMADKVELATVREEVIDEQTDSVDEFNDEDLITISEQMSDLVTEASDDSEIYDKIDLGFGNENERPTPNRLHLPKRSQVLPAEEMIVEREDHENYQIIFYNGIACCGCDKYFSSQDDLDFHCREHHKLKRQTGGIYCSLCKNKFPSLSIKIRHATQRSIPKLYACKLCEYVCRDRAAIERHMEFSVIHKKPMMRFDKVKEAFERIPVDGHLCCDCYQMFPDNAQLEKHHQDAHHPNRVSTKNDALKTCNFWCSNCHQVFKHGHRYQSHRKRSKVKSIYRCLKDGCTYRTGSIIFARLHLRSRDHKLPDIISEQTTPINSSHTSTNQRCCFRKCLQVFDSKQSLQEHVDQVHQVKLLENELRRKKSTHVCSICNCNFESRRALKRHLLVKIKNFVCDQCGLSVASAFQLRSHVQQVHSNVHIQKNFKCNECPRSFVSEANLQRHKRRGHDKPSDNVCSICGKQFKNKETLWHHWRIHNKTESLECEPCKKAGRRYQFRNLKTLRRHYKISEMHNGERKHKCTYEGCTNAYAHKPDLQRHEQTVHRGDRPFQCKVCGKGFVRDRDLRLHERHHTGAKLFSCEDCSEGFNVFKEYKKHFSEVHGKVFMIKCEMGNLGSRK